MPTPNPTAAARFQRRRRGFSRAPFVGRRRSGGDAYQFTLVWKGILGFLGGSEMRVVFRGARWLQGEDTPAFLAEDTRLSTRVEHPEGLLWPSGFGS